MLGGKALGRAVHVEHWPFRSTRHWVLQWRWKPKCLETKLKAASSPAAPSVALLRKEQSDQYCQRIVWMKNGTHSPREVLPEFIQNLGFPQPMVKKFVFQPWEFPFLSTLQLHFEDFAVELSLASIYGAATIYLLWGRRKPAVWAQIVSDLN